MYIQVVGSSSQARLVGTIFFALCLLWLGRPIERAEAAPCKADTPCPCEFNRSWITKPELPDRMEGKEVFAGHPNHPCLAHKHAWKTFFHFMSPDPEAEKKGAWRYEMLRVLGERPCEGCKNNLLDTKRDGWFVRTEKSSDPIESQTQIRFLGLNDSIDAIGFHDTSAVTICGGQPWQRKPPDRPSEEGIRALYDKHGNIVFYNVRHADSLCVKYKDEKLPDNFRTTEMKFAWRQITPEEEPYYFTIVRMIKGKNGQKEEKRLGLIGLHIARAVQWHKSMIWMTFEHRLNAPNCGKPMKKGGAGWSFTTNDCIDCLIKNKSEDDCRKDLKHKCSTLNVGHWQATGTPEPTGKPTHLCRRNPNGGGDKKSQTAVANLNKGMKAALDDLMNNQETRKKFAALEIWKNYALIGTTWLRSHLDPSDEKVDGLPNPSGSTDLANISLEPFSQHLSCFSCHKYKGPKKASSTSHILPNR